MIQLHKDIEGRSKNAAPSTVNELYKRATHDKRNVFGDEFISSYLQRLMNNSKLSKSDLISELIEIRQIHPTSFEIYEYLIQYADEDDVNALLPDDVIISNFIDQSSPPSLPSPTTLSKRRIYANIVHHFPEKPLGSICLGMILMHQLLRSEEFQNNFENNNQSHLKVLDRIVEILSPPLKFFPIASGYYYLALAHFHLNQLKKSQEIINSALLFIKKQMSAPNFSVLQKLLFSSLPPYPYIH